MEYVLNPLASDWLVLTLELQLDITTIALEELRRRITFLPQCATILFERSISRTDAVLQRSGSVFRIGARQPRPLPSTFGRGMLGRSSSRAFNVVRLWLKKPSLL